VDLALGNGLKAEHEFRPAEAKALRVEPPEEVTARKAKK
jgi:hypothetical protein